MKRVVWKADGFLLNYWKEKDEIDAENRKNQAEAERKQHLGGKS